MWKIFVKLKDVKCTSSKEYLWRKKRDDGKDRRNPVRSNETPE